MILGLVASKPIQPSTANFLGTRANLRVHKFVALRIEFTHMKYIGDAMWGRSELGQDDSDRKNPPVSMN